MIEVSDSVSYGLLLTSVHDRSVPARQQIDEHHELISLAVELGFDLVVAGQHFAAPALRYLQPIPYLTSIAIQFPTVHVATGIILLPLHHPLHVAEEVATMDAVTDGRVIMGLGIGYLQDEFDAFGIDRSTRTERFEESIEIIRALWSGEPLTHRGSFFDDLRAIHVAGGHCKAKTFEGRIRDSHGPSIARWIVSRMNILHMGITICRL